MQVDISDIRKQLEAGNLSGALRLCETKRKKHPADPQLALVAGDIHFHIRNLDSAAQAYNQAQQLGIASPQLYANLGNITQMKAHLTGNPDLYPQAIRQHQKALELDPEFYPSHIALTEIHLNLQQHDVAAQHLAKARAKGRDTIEENIYQGVLHMRSHPPQPEAAEACYRKVLTQQPDYVPALLYLAQLCARRMDMEQAQTLLSRLPEEQRGNDLYLNIAAQIAASDKDYSRAARLNLACADATRNPNDKASVLHLAAQQFDKIGHYEEAYQLCLRAKQSVREAIGFEKLAHDKKHCGEGFRHLRQMVITEGLQKTFQAYSDITATEEIPIFVVGFPRSGTTLMEQMLNAHPGVQTSNESPILSTLIRQLPAITQGRQYPYALTELEEQDILRLRTAYWECSAQFGLAPNTGKRKIDKLPLNITHLGLIHALFPTAPIIVCLRDPRDAILSAFMQSFKYNPSRAYMLSLPEIAELYDQVMGLYLAYRQHLPTLPVCEYRYEDLVREPEKIMRRILEFSQLEWRQEVLEHHRNLDTRIISTPSYKDVVKPLYSSAHGKWSHYSHHFAALGPVLLPYVRAFGYTP